MRLAKILSGLGVLIMLGAIIYGFTSGDFGAEGAQLLALPWGRVTMIDIYISFAVFSGWIVFREKSALRSIVWIIFMITLGSLTACLYVFLALQSSGGNWKKFWFGNRLADAG
ncbi:MAG: DUF1475 family protein [Anaerolineae bacterium]|nr:DUF1475 family protein [Anaerolineae bacterium]